GVVPCTCMSMMSHNLIASACEADLAGVVGLYALQQASHRPAALWDWNNNYGADRNKGAVFHGSSLPKAFFGEEEGAAEEEESLAGDGMLHELKVLGGQRMDYQEIIAGTVGKENTFGTIVGRIAPGPFTYA